MRMAFILFQSQSQRNFLLSCVFKLFTPPSLTEGPISQALISFALRCFWATCFQQLYNTADSLIVGNLSGQRGAGRRQLLRQPDLPDGRSGQRRLDGRGRRHRALFRREGLRPHTKDHPHAAGLRPRREGALLTVYGVALSPVMLRLMDTPEAVLPDSISYFRTYFTGSLAFVLYNICMGIFAGRRRQPPPATIPDYFFPRQRRARPALCRRVPHGRVDRRRGDGHFPVGEHEHFACSA